MKIELDKITINERVRKDFLNIDTLAESIKELGLLQPILVSKDNQLIAGHRRFLACEKLGLKEIECNKINPKNELHKLDMELAENVKREDFNPMELSDGMAKRKDLYEFEYPETIRGFAGGQATKEKLTGAEREVRDKPTFVESTSKLLNMSPRTVEETLQLQNINEKDKIKVRDNKLKKSQALAIHRKEKRIEKVKEEVKELSAEAMGIYEGDCLKELDNVKDNTVSCLIIDPPYGIDFQSNFKLATHDKIKNDNKEALNLLDKSLAKVKPKMLKDSHLYIFTHWKVFEFIKPIIEKHFDIKNTLIWNKNNWSMGDLEGNYAEKYEMIIFGSQGNRKLLGEQRPVNVLDFERTTNSNHPTEKPINLLKELIKNSTVEGELVLDYFAGSGSTMLASKQLGRKAIAIESDKEYVDMIKSRTKEFSK